MSGDDVDPSETLTLAHGAGTGRMREFLASSVEPRFESDGTATVGLDALDDGAVLPTTDDRLVVTTDSHVVDPSVFPGGDVGSLAAAGTINDLAAMGATEPASLTCSLIVAAGTRIDRVERYLDSLAATAATADTTVSTGDTKVMRSDEVDGVVLNTTGVGFVGADGPLPASGLSAGDNLIVTGSVGDHGLAVLAAREGFDFETSLESDVAPVAHLVAGAREAGTVTAATDPTRGGLATATNELATAADVGIELDERAIPVHEATAGAAEVLGIDPLTVACEGRMVLGVSPEDTDAILDQLRELDGGADAAVVGQAVADHPGEVVLNTGVGERYLTEPSGQQLPRIC